MRAERPLTSTTHSVRTSLRQIIICFVLSSSTYEGKSSTSTTISKQQSITYSRQSLEVWAKGISDLPNRWRRLLISIVNTSLILGGFKKRWINEKKKLFGAELSWQPNKIYICAEFKTWNQWSFIWIQVRFTFFYQCDQCLLEGWRSVLQPIAFFKIISWVLFINEHLKIDHNQGFNGFIWEKIKSPENLFSEVLKSVFIASHDLAKFWSQ